MVYAEKRFLLKLMEVKIKRNQKSGGEEGFKNR